MKNTSLILAIAIILASDGIALIGTTHNRAGDAVQTIQLTERELPILNADQENTGVDLNISWSQFPSPSIGSVLDRKQLEASGFVFSAPPSEATKNVAFLPREAYVALEYEGQKWNEWQQWAKQHSTNDQSIIEGNPGAPPTIRSPRSASHLFVVDASKSMSELRTRYPDQSKYLIVRAVLMAQTYPVKGSPAGEVASYRYIGRVMQIMPNVIHVPIPYSRAISFLKPRREGEPRYTATLKYGNSLEPWVSAVNLLPK
jgi:hypothetical protein